MESESTPSQTRGNDPRTPIILGIVLFAAIGFGVYYLTNQPSSPSEELSSIQVTRIPTQQPTPTSKPEETDTSILGSETTQVEQADVQVIALTGRNFSYSINEIRVKSGDTIHIDFTSEEGMHNFVIDELNVETETVNTGESTSVEFVVDQVGTFDFYCSIGSHRAFGMEGSFIVE